MSRRIEKEAVFPTSPERLWRALTTPEELAGWMGPDATIDLRVGGRLQIGPAGGAEITEIAAPHRLVVHWEIYGPDQPVVGTFTLEAVNGGTRLVVTEEGFSNDERGTWCMAGSDPGWVGWLQNIQDWLDSGKRAVHYEYGRLQASLGLRSWEGMGSGVFLKKLQPDGAAEQAGLQVEDTLLTWNGKPVPGPADFWHYVWTTPAVDPVTLTVDRAGREVTVLVKLAPIS